MGGWAKLTTTIVELKPIQEDVHFTRSADSCICQAGVKRNIIHVEPIEKTLEGRQALCVLHAGHCLL